MGCLDQLRDFRLNALVENFFLKEQTNERELVAQFCETLNRFLF